MGDMTIRPEDVPVVVEELTETDVLANTPKAGGERDLRITDSTLRDGSHAMSHQFTEEQVRGVVHALDSAGVQVIEVVARRRPRRLELQLRLLQGRRDRSSSPPPSRRPPRPRSPS